MQDRQSAPSWSNQTAIMDGRPRSPIARPAAHGFDDDAETCLLDRASAMPRYGAGAPVLGHRSWIDEGPSLEMPPPIETPRYSGLRPIWIFTALFFVAIGWQAVPAAIDRLGSLTTSLETSR
jgi:hypothetical protein